MRTAHVFTVFQGWGSATSFMGSKYKCRRKSSYTPSVSINATSLRGCQQFCCQWKKWSQLKMGCNSILVWYHCFQSEQNRECHCSIDADAWYKRTLTCDWTLTLDGLWLLWLFLSLNWNTCSEVPCHNQGTWNTRKFKQRTVDQVVFTILQPWFYLQKFRGADDADAAVRRDEREQTKPRENRGSTANREY